MTPANGHIDPETLAELQRLARSRPRSGRQSVAKASALRTLERLGRSRPRGKFPPRPPGWHPGPEELEELDRWDSPVRRERWWRELNRLGRVSP
jgi:hypothetical protein